MNWELYEVWSVDEDGHEDLIDTTKSLKEAEYYAECIIYREDEDGELVEIERVQ
jgi:hypothetical protein